MLRRRWHRACALSCLLFLTAFPGVGRAGDFALRFFGHGVDAPDLDRVKIRIDDPALPADPGPPVDVGAQDFTIEFWIKAQAADNPAPAIRRPRVDRRV
jgi:hypothetical protein